MDDDKLFADPLRHLDARFEPVDPIFDADEAEFPRFRRRRPRAAAAAILATLACSGAERPAVYAEDSILVQLQRNGKTDRLTSLPMQLEPQSGMAVLLCTDKRTAQTPQPIQAQMSC